MVAAVPGVVTLYPAQAAPVVAVVSLVARVARTEIPPLVVVSGSVRPAGAASAAVEEDDGMAVAVTIGVTEAVSAAETCREVYAAIVAHIARSGVAPARSVSVLVGAIT